MYGLDYVALRYFNVYGPRMDIHGRYTEVMVRWMERIDAGEPPIIFGDGLQTMDLVHVTRRGARQHPRRRVAPATDVVFNVGSGTETSLLDLAQRASPRAMGRPDPCTRCTGRSGRSIRCRDASPRRPPRGEMLGFRTTVRPHEGIADLVAWWRSETKPARTRETAS